MDGPSAPDRILESERLRLRPERDDDYAFVRRLHTDPEVMRHITGGRLRTEEETRRSVADGLRLAAEHRGHGIWTAELRHSGEPVGRLILRKPSSTPPLEGLEIGYTIVPEHQGKGLATEASRLLIDFAFRHAGAQRIVALIDPKHAASRGVLLRLGFHTGSTTTYIDPLTGNTLPAEVLVLDAPGR